MCTVRGLIAGVALSCRVQKTRGHEPINKKTFDSTNSFKSIKAPYLHVATVRGSDVKAVPPRGDYVAVTWTALPSAFPIYCLLFHMCPEARQSTNTIHGGII